MPGVRRACERYMDPNFPAPMSKTRTGWRAEARASRSRRKFIRGITVAMRGAARRRQAAWQVYRTGAKIPPVNDHAMLDNGLLERLATLRPGLDALGLPACVIDTNRRYRYANAVYAALSNRAPSEFDGPAVEELFPMHIPDARRSALAQALSGEVVIFNRQMLAGPRAGTWVRAHYVPVHSRDQVVGALVVLVDIQQLKDTEAALADQRKQLQLVVDSIGVPMSYID